MIFMLLSHAVTQVAIGLSVEACIQSWASHVKFMVEKVAWGQAFSFQDHSTIAP